MAKSRVPCNPASSFTPGVLFCKLESLVVCLFALAVAVAKPFLNFLFGPHSRFLFEVILAG